MFSLTQALTVSDAEQLTYVQHLQVSMAVAVAVVVMAGLESQQGTNDMSISSTNQCVGFWGICSESSGAALPDAMLSSHTPVLLETGDSFSDSHTKSVSHNKPHALQLWHGWP